MGKPGNRHGESDSHSPQQGGERMELAPGGHMVGVPHTPGTREYLTCDSGQIELIAAGEHHVLSEDDMLVFRGDQRHSYPNPDSHRTCVAISVVCFAS